MENKEFAQVVGNRSAPYTNRLARRYGLATGLYAVAHPSLPNYLALTAGSTFGIHTDCTHCRVAHVNLIDQLSAAGISWKAYVGGMPAPCFGGTSAAWYRMAINPFAYLSDIASNPSRCSRVVPDSALSDDLGKGRLADFSWISPNLCNDGHSCGVRRGDRYLARVVPTLLRELGPHGLLIVTWDEGHSGRGCCGFAGAGGGHVPLILAGPDVRRHGISRDPATDYTVLRMVEASFGLPPLRRAATAPHDPLGDLLWKRPPIS
jgi:phosphatidylinositol-3-phosphatase